LREGIGLGDDSLKGRVGGLSWFDFLQGKVAKAAHNSGKAQDLDLR